MDWIGAAAPGTLRGAMDDPRVDLLIRYGGGFTAEPVVRARGSWLETAGGGRMLDFTAGQICATVGHNHPRVMAAIQRSLESVIHLNSWMLSPPVLDLAAAAVVREDAGLVVALFRGPQAHHAFRLIMADRATP